MTAQPTEDPADPLVILRVLPEREHEEFLRQYHRAVDAAHDPAGYQRLRRLLHVWSLTAVAAGQPGYYEELEAARAGTVTTVPVTDAIPDWVRTSRRGPGPAVTYRAELSGRALKQMHGLPGPAFDRLIEAMAEVIDYPDDPLRTLPTGCVFLEGALFRGVSVMRRG